MLTAETAPRQHEQRRTVLHRMIVPVFQPIYNLRRGRVVGFEALARLAVGHDLLNPAQFISALNADELLRLFSTMLSKSMAFLEGLGTEAGDLYVSINVNASIILQPDFVDLVRFTLAAYELRPARLVVELLEGEAISSIEAMVEAIRRLKQLGIAVALDDVGSAYASLTHIKDLPVDILKLDHTFSRLLPSRPADLQFISSLLGLARGLGRVLVVEGAETADVVDALAIIGVEFAQGFALGKPMYGSHVGRWLTTSAIALTPGPNSLLGLYAAHLTIVEACRVLANQPLKMTWHTDAADPHICRIGRYLDAHGLHDTDYGLAHKRFHQALSDVKGAGDAWKVAAEDLRTTLLAALAPRGAAAPRDCPAEPVFEKGV